MYRICRYHQVGVDGVDYGARTLSEWGAVYAERQDRGETDRESRWRVLAVVRHGKLAAVKTDVVVAGTRYVDHLLHLRVVDGWRIAAAWGPAPAS
ncbi:nuclear transport factor 2 family protein [Nannocystis pusilla]|uniref:nuclear transport factor 2 family protein n=1 Tax=Nannocystis pusilla TaxID=889268 RepID=UPI003BEFACE4